MTRYRESSELAFSTEWRARLSGSYQYSGIDTIMNNHIMEDELHPGYKNSTSGDNGGIMYHYSSKTSANPARIDWDSPASDWSPAGYGNAHGLCLPSYMLYHGEESFGIAMPSDQEILGLGATAMSRTRPTKSSVDFSTTIGELRQEGIPHLVGLEALRAKSKFLKTSGSEYLNVEFGWKPLISDLLKFGRAVKNSTKIINQFRKGSDQKIRRRYNFPQAFTSGQVFGSFIMRPYYLLDQMPTGVKIYEESNMTWFSGAFKYHVPLGDDLPSKLARYEQEANKLFATRLTPEVVWNLQPWSWAVDWFSNTGDVLSNISAMGNDGMVMQYGYVMNKHMTRITLQTDPFYYARTGKWLQCGLTKEILTERRLGASPYGFFVNIPGLTARQDAIVVALGIAKSQR